MSEQDITRAFSFLLEMKQPGREGATARFNSVRALAELARKNEIARMMIENGIAHIEQLPQKGCKAGARQMWRHIPIFKAYYLEGDRRPSIHAVAIRFYVNDSKITKSLRAVIGELVPYFCGKNYDDNAAEGQIEAPEGRYTSIRD